MIELIVLDVDGTLTDGKITYSNSGEETKSFDVADGLAIAVWTKNFGKKAAIITGRNHRGPERLCRLQPARREPRARFPDLKTCLERG